MTFPCITGPKLKAGNCHPSRYPLSSTFLPQISRLASINCRRSESSLKLWMDPRGDLAAAEMGVCAAARCPQSVYTGGRWAGIITQYDVSFIHREGGMKDEEGLASGNYCPGVPGTCACGCQGERIVLRRGAGALPGAMRTIPHALARGMHDGMRDRLPELRLGFRVPPRA
jgi:hypothetical protein